MFHAMSTHLLKVQIFYEYTQLCKLWYANLNIDWIVQFDTEYISLKLRVYS